MNAKDWNGHTPAVDTTAEICTQCRREVNFEGRSADYRLGYQAAILDVIGKIAEQHQARLDELLARLERRPA